MKIPSLLLAFLVLATLPAAQVPLTRRSEGELRHRAAVAEKYARPAWPRGAVRAGLPTALALEGFASEAPVCEDGLLVRTFARAADGVPAFVLESRVADDALGAEEELVDWLAGLQSTARMPSVAEAGFAVGDAGFVGRSGARPGALAWIAFVRGNVAVRVTACELAATPELDLVPLARALDRAILATPALEAARKPLRPALARFEAARTAKAGDVVPLAVEVEDIGATLQWRVGGAGQGYVEADADGSWRLHTTGPGATTVELHVIGTLGTVTSRTLTLDVHDE